MEGGDTLTDRQLEQRWLEQNRAENLRAAEGEDAETQAEWEHMARIRAETAKPVPYIPGDKL